MAISFLLWNEEKSVFGFCFKEIFVFTADRQSTFSLRDFLRVRFNRFASVFCSL